MHTTLENGIYHRAKRLRLSDFVLKMSTPGKITDAELVFWAYTYLPGGICEIAGNLQG